MVLATEGLTKRFRGRTAVEDLFLRVGKGDIYGFLGPNGAGKTTTLRMALGLLRPTAGRVTLFGEALTLWRRAPLGRVGALVETPSLYAYLSGRDNLRLFADLSGGCDGARIDAALDRVGLRGRERDPVRVYSHGMKQRLALAAALLPRPELLILDEPMNGLDPRGIRDVRDLLLSLARDDGLTILFSSHLLAEVQQVCNRVGILREGRLLWEGNLRDLAGGERRVRIRAAPADQAAAVLRALPGARVEPDAAEPGLFRVAGPVDASDLVAALVAAGCRVREAAPEAPALEDVFLELVERPGETSSDTLCAH